MQCSTYKFSESLFQVGSAVVGGMLLGLIEGMGLLMNNFMSQQFRPQDPRMQEMPEEPPMVLQ